MCGSHKILNFCTETDDGGGHFASTSQPTLKALWAGPGHLKPPPPLAKSSSGIDYEMHSDNLSCCAALYNFEGTRSMDGASS